MRVCVCVGGGGVCVCVGGCVRGCVGVRMWVRARVYVGVCVNA